MTSWQGSPLTGGRIDLHDADQPDFALRDAVRHNGDVRVLGPVLGHHRAVVLRTQSDASAARHSPSDSRPMSVLPAGNCLWPPVHRLTRMLCTRHAPGGLPSGQYMPVLKVTNHARQSAAVAHDVIESVAGEDEDVVDRLLDERVHDVLQIHPDRIG